MIKVSEESKIAKTAFEKYVYTIEVHIFISG
jgi:hypothetical protein